MNVNAVKTQDITVGTAAANTNAAKQDSGDFSDIILKIVSGSQDSENSTIEMLSDSMKKDSDKDIKDMLSQLLAQLGSSQLTNADSLTEQMQNTDGTAYNLLQALDNVSDTSDISDISNIQQLMQMQNVLSSDGSTQTQFSNLLKLFTENADDDGIIPTSSAIPLNALYQLAKAEKIEGKMDFSDIDFNNLSDSEKIQVLKNAVENGEITISKDTDWNSVVNQLSESYNLSQAVKNSGKEVQSETADFKKDINISEKDLQPETEGSSKSINNFGKIEDTDTENAEAKKSSEVFQNVEQTVIDYNGRTAEIPEQVKTDGTPEENAVFNQTLDSVYKSIEAGRENYTAKLNPQGLGEITVKMAKDESGIVINIVASSQKTAEILNSHLNDLQASLSTYNAQVNQAVVVQSQETAQYSGYNFGGQNFGGANQQYAGNNQRQGYYYRAADESDNTAETGGHLREGIINTYI